MTSIGILSPKAFAAALPVMPLLLSFSPEHFFDLSWFVLLITHL